jgi:hypothetical protein
LSERLSAAEEKIQLQNSTISSMQQKLNAFEQQVQIAKVLASSRGPSVKE